MKTKLLLVTTLLGALALPTSATATQQIKCVDRPLEEREIDPDRYCPEDIGTDPTGLAAFITEEPDVATGSRAEHAGKDEPAPR